jgi:hypothetical protein
VTEMKRCPSTTAGAPTAPTDTADANRAIRQVLVERGKAIVDSGKHAPPPSKTADELRYWIGRSQPGDVVNLDDYRRRRGA